MKFHVSLGKTDEAVVAVFRNLPVQKAAHIPCSPALAPNPKLDGRLSCMAP